MIHKLNTAEEFAERSKESKVYLKEIFIPSDYWSEDYTLFRKEEEKRAERKPLSPQRYESKKPSNFNWDIKDGDYIIRDPELNGLTQNPPRANSMFLYLLATMAVAVFITYMVLDLFTSL